MMRFVKAAPVALLAFGLATAPSSANAVHQETYVQLSAAEKVSSRVDRTKAWLKTKKSQTSRWVGRQKQKLKRAID